MTTYIRSSKLSIKFGNTNKIQKLDTIRQEYFRVMKEFIITLWDMDHVPKFISKEITSQPNTFLSARMRQCAAKQASGIVRGTKKKQEKREYVLGTLKPGSQEHKRLKTKIETVKMSCPVPENVNMEIDSRFVKIEMDGDTTFDVWITLGSIGNKIKIALPLKATKHVRNMMSKGGTLLNSIRIEKDKVVLFFEMEQKENGGTETIGIDIGQSTLLSCSNGQLSNPCHHGHDMKSINDKMSRKKKGSKGFERAQAHRDNYINMTVKRLNFDSVKEIRIENIKNLFKGKVTNRTLSHWNYAAIFSKLLLHCESQGVLVTRVNPTYTSKRCSGCGWTKNSNRKGKIFNCVHCGNAMDADLNAAQNIAIVDLEPIGYHQRHKVDVKRGFFWLTSCGQESIVPVVQKTVLT